MAAATSPLSGASKIQRSRCEGKVKSLDRRVRTREGPVGVWAGGLPGQRHSVMFPVADIRARRFKIPIWVQGVLAESSSPYHYIIELPLVQTFIK